MSAILTGLWAKQREEAEQQRSRGEKPPGTRPIADGLLALIPAEAVALHAIWIDATTTTTSSVNSRDGAESGTAEAEQVIVTVDDEVGLLVGFACCVGVAVFAYWLGHRRQRPGKFGRDLDFDLRDIFRALAVAAAFVVWAVVSDSPLVDAVTPSWLSDGVREGLAVTLGVAILLVGWQTARSADEQTPVPTAGRNAEEAGRVQPRPA